MTCARTLQSLLLREFFIGARPAGSTFLSCTGMHPELLGTGRSDSPTPASRLLDLLFFNVLLEVRGENDEGDKRPSIDTSASSTVSFS